MNIILVEGAHDEHSLLGYEKHDKGDQTGDEVRYHDYYSCVGYDENKPWTFVFRPIDTNCAVAIATRMKQSADNHFVGYGQIARTDIFYALTNDPDPSHIKYPIDCDCSSLVNSVVYVTYKMIGHTLPMTGVETTAEMPAKYTAMNRFFKNVTKEIDISTGSGLMIGDILVRPMSHTAVVVEVANDVKTVTPITDLYVRDQAGTYIVSNGRIRSTTIVDVIHPGLVLNVLEEKKAVGGSTWYKVQYDNKYGWCSARFVK